MNHVEISQSLLRDLPTAPNLETQKVLAAAAQAHATLALVEQTRMTNLIALSQAEDGNGWTSEQAIAAVFREHWNDSKQQGHCTIAPDVAEALGLPEFSDEDVETYTIDGDDVEKLVEVPEEPEAVDEPTIEPAARSLFDRFRGNND